MTKAVQEALTEWSKHMFKRVMMFGVALAAAGTLVAAQGTTPQTPAPQGTAQAAPPRIASPAGSSQTQIGGTTGKWIEITYGRPIKRGRDVWGSGPTYAQLLLVNGAKVWRAGANVSTRLKTDVPLQIGGKTVPAGEYSLFIDTKSPTDWTLIVSSWGAKSEGRRDQTPDTLWGRSATRRTRMSHGSR